jgi:imidazolonepropionase-like amidohydrolase
MSMRRLGWRALFAAALVTPPAAAQGAEPAPKPGAWAVVYCGTLLAVPGQPPQNVSVVVHDGKVAQVVPGRVDPGKIEGLEAGATAQVVDLSDRFVMPGLVDCHVHLTMEFTRDLRLRQVEESDSVNAINGAVWAKRTLEAGFTTVRDLGAVGEAIFALRRAITEDKVPGPRILAAGYAISPTGGHADRTLGYREGLFAIPTAMQGAADGPDACRQAVRSQVKRGADVIKFTATGGVLSNTAAGTEQQFFDDEMAAVVQTAHLLGRKVAAHAHGKRGIEAALRAGVDSIEHGTFLDDQTIALFKEKGAYLVPTILAGITVAENAEIAGYYTPPVAAKARTVGKVIQGALGRAFKGGVKIAFGTDSGVSPHGHNAREFELLVGAGVPPIDAIKAATVNAADLLGLSDQIGTVEPGKSADLVATAGNPLDDIKELRRVRCVMRAGVVHKKE